MPLPRTLLGARKTSIGDTDPCSPRAQFGGLYIRMKTRTGRDPGQFNIGFVVAKTYPPPTSPPPEKKKSIELTRSRISLRSLILSFLAHWFYKKK